MTVGAWPKMQMTNAAIQTTRGDIGNVFRIPNPKGCIRSGTLTMYPSGRMAIRQWQKRNADGGFIQRRIRIEAGLVARCFHMASRIGRFRR